MAYTISRRNLLLAPLAGCLAPALALGRGAAIWAAGDGDDIDRDAVDDPRRARNSVWDGKRVRLFGARNEVLAFQVVVTTATTGVQQAAGIRASSNLRRPTRAPRRRCPRALRRQRGGPGVRRVPCQACTPGRCHRARVATRLPRLGRTPGLRHAAA